MAPPTYAERLRVEGRALAVCGAVASGLLLTLAPQARRRPGSTLWQLAVVALVVVRMGPRSARRSMKQAREVPASETGSGEPTPLWQMPLVVGGQALLFKALERLPGPRARRAGWDASLRTAAGSTLVGLGQALLLGPAVRADERASDRTYYRAPGSHLGRRTPLIYAR
jgi:hypothetical protein